MEIAIAIGGILILAIILCIIFPDAAPFILDIAGDIVSGIFDD